MASGSRADLTQSRAGPGTPVRAGHKSPSPAGGQKLTSQPDPPQHPNKMTSKSYRFMSTQLTPTRATRWALHHRRHCRSTKDAQSKLGH